MKRKGPVLIEVCGETEPTEEFLLCYQRAILCTLAERGTIAPKMLAECIGELEP